MRPIIWLYREPDSPIKWRLRNAALHHMLVARMAEFNRLVPRVVFIPSPNDKES